jgi:hypothetical protein
MLFRHWFSSRKRPVRSFCPSVLQLEDRTVPSAVAVVPPPLPTSVVVRAPAQAATGAATPIFVAVLDQSGHQFLGFTGSVTFTSSDPKSAINSNIFRGARTALPNFTYTFTPGDHGAHTFSFIFGTASPQGTPTTVTASVASGSISLTRGASLTVFPATTVTHFGLFATSHTPSGVPAPVLVEALNASNQAVPTYTGTVTFTSSDSAAKIRATQAGVATALKSFSYQFTTGNGKDNGQHVFWLTFGTAGPQTLTVSDSTNNITCSFTFAVASLFRTARR